MNICIFIHKNFRYQKVQCSTSLRMEAHENQGIFIHILQATCSIKSYWTAVSMSLLLVDGYESVPAARKRWERGRNLQRPVRWQLRCKMLWIHFFGQNELTVIFPEHWFSVFLFFVLTMHWELISTCFNVDFLRPELAHIKSQLEHSISINILLDRIVNIEILHQPKIFHGLQSASWSGSLEVPSHVVHFLGHFTHFVLHCRGYCRGVRPSWISPRYDLSSIVIWKRHWCSVKEWLWIISRRQLWKPRHPTGIQRTMLEGWPSRIPVIVVDWNMTAIHD